MKDEYWLCYNLEHYYQNMFREYVTRLDLHPGRQITLRNESHTLMKLSFIGQQFAFLFALFPLFYLTKNNPIF